MDLLVEVPSLTNRKIVHGIQTIPSKEKHHPAQCQYVLEFFFWYTTLNVSVGGRDQPLGAIGQITDTP